MLDISASYVKPLQSVYISVAPPALPRVTEGTVDAAHQKDCFVDERHFHIAGLWNDDTRVRPYGRHVFVFREMNRVDVRCRQLR